MFGPDYLVAPQLKENATERTVYDREGEGEGEGGGDGEAAKGVDSKALLGCTPTPSVSSLSRGCTLLCINYADVRNFDDSH